MTGLVEALGARGLVCVVGAGGKKSALYRLAADLERAVLTATVRIPIFDNRVGRVVVTDDPLSAVREADGETSRDVDGKASTDVDGTGDGGAGGDDSGRVDERERGDRTDDGGSAAWPLGVVPARDGADRYRGFEPETVVDLADAVDLPVLVKADGARSRWFKAPGEDEPRLPATADLVVPVVSARVVGHPIDERRVHRPGRVARLLDADVGDDLDAADVARVVAHPEGGLAGVPGTARVVPLVNMVDTPELARTGRTIAREIHRRADVDRVVLTRLLDPAPVVDVVERPE